MPLVDDKGNPVDIPIAGSLSEAGSNLSTLPRALASTLPPALIAGGAGYGAELGAAALGLGPWAAIPAAIGAAGLANVASSKMLPKSLGGQPDASLTSDFLWGAVPEGLGRAAGVGLHAAAARRLSHAGQALMEQGRQSVLDPENLTVQENLLNPPKPPRFDEMPSSGPQRTARANEARQPILDIVHRMRKRYGEPIGQAYDALKGEQPLTEDETGSLADSARNVTTSMISPGPLTRKYAGILEGMAKPEEGAVEVIPGLVVTPEQMRQSGMSSSDIAGLSGQEWKPPTLDRLRNLRQQINLDLQKAQGGDRYGLGALQDSLDDRLMGYLPDNMDELRRNYRGMIHRWGYDRERALSNFADPKEIVGSVFKNPADANELMQEAGSGQNQNALRERFIQYVWGDLPAGAADKDAAKEIRSRLAPYVNHPDTLRAYLGNDAGNTMSEMVAWGKYAPKLDQYIRKDPKVQAAFAKGFNDYFLNRGMNPADATVKSLQDLMGQMPGAADIAGSTPLLSHPGQGSHSFSNVLAARHGTMAALHLATGNPAWGALQAAEALTWLSGSKGFTASSKLGVTRFMLNAFKAKTPMEAGWWMAHGLNGVLHFGSQLARQAEPVETDNAP